MDTKSRKFRCPGCGYVYDENKGAPREGYPPGTPFALLPEDFACPDCAVREKPDFQADFQTGPKQ